MNRSLSATLRAARSKQAAFGLSAIGAKALSGLRLGKRLVEGRGVGQARNFMKKSVGGLAQRLFNPVGKGLANVSGKLGNGRLSGAVKNIGNYIGGVDKWAPGLGKGYFGGGLGQTLGNLTGSVTRMSVYGVPTAITLKGVDYGVGKLSGGQPPQEEYWEDE
jgi:hypothetical protein